MFTYALLSGLGERDQPQAATSEGIVTVLSLINYVARSLHLVDTPIPFLNSFTWALPSGGGPGRATEILITYIYKLGFNQTRFDYAAAVTVTFFLLLLGITYLANRLSGGNAGAVERD